MGCSGILSSLLNPLKSATTASEHWRLVFLGSFVLTVFFTTSLLGDTKDDRLENAPDVIPVASTIAMCLGGFLVGLGTRLGNGCTTGHGICGMSRLSKRSLVSVCTFTACSMATAAALASPKTPWADRTSFLRSDSLPAVSKVLSMAVTAAALLLAMLRQTKPEDATSMHQEKVFGASASGALFAVGLAVSGMVKKSKVHDFLDLCSLCRSQGTFDPTLISVLGSANVISWLSYQYVWRRKHCTPACGSCWSIPSNTNIDVPLVAGAVLFGIGWGLTGLCPGPALYAAAAGVVDVVLAWFPAFLVGSYVGNHAKHYLLRSPNKVKTL